MPPDNWQYAAPLGRLLMTPIFLSSAYNKLIDWDLPIKMMQDRGVPAPHALLAIAVALELLGGLLVLTGFRARWGAILLLVFILPVTFAMHNFWTLPPDQQMPQMINFMKNLTIAGGLLMVVAFGSGPLSIDNLRRSTTGQSA